MLHSPYLVTLIYYSCRNGWLGGWLAGLLNQLSPALLEFGFSLTQIHVCKFPTHQCILTDIVHNSFEIFYRDLCSSNFASSPNFADLLDCFELKNILTLNIYVRVTKKIK